MFVIYKILNLITGKYYVGHSVDFKERWRQHRCYLANGNHDNKYLQNSFAKYGKKNFVFSIIEFCKSEEDMLEKEQWHIDNAEGFRYNLNPIANKPPSRKGVRFTIPESRRIKYTEANRARGKRVFLSRLNEYKEAIEFKEATNSSWRTTAKVFGITRDTLRKAKRYLESSEYLNEEKVQSGD